MRMKCEHKLGDGNEDQPPAQQYCRCRCCGQRISDQEPSYHGDQNAGEDGPAGALLNLVGKSVIGHKLPSYSVWVSRTVLPPEELRGSVYRGAIGSAAVRL